MQTTKMVTDREKEAANAYLTFLQNKGASSGMLYLRSKFLDTFILKLAEKPLNRKEFAHTLECMLENMPQDDKHHALMTAREFFPFWMGDIKAIAMFEEYYAFSASDNKWQPKQVTLHELTQALESTVLTDEESQPLNIYLQAIIRLGANRSVVQTRSKLVKMILLRLREAPVINHATYRIAVDLTLPLFEKAEIKKIYLSVVREFYYFWINDPAAESKIFDHN